MATVETELVETHNIIVNAMRRDFANISSITIGDYTVGDVEEQDPLGLAFYTYAMLKTGYVNQEIGSLTVTWKLWVDEKLRQDQYGSYIDTELASLGLILYALAPQEQLPDNYNSFIHLVERHFSDTKGIYKNFLATVMVGLGVSQIAREGDLFSRIQRYLDEQLRNCWGRVFNDTKNYVTVYWWSREVNADDVLEKLRNECLQRLHNQDYLVRDIVYISYVLFEEVSAFPRYERPKIKDIVEQSLRFIRDYTIESDLSSELINEYGQDVALASRAIQDQYGYPIKPRLSRILLSVGHLTERRYFQHKYLLDNADQQKRRWLRIALYAPTLCLISVLIFWLGMKWGVIGNFKDDFT